MLKGTCCAYAISIFIIHCIFSDNVHRHNSNEIKKKICETHINLAKSKTGYLGLDRCGCQKEKHIMNDSEIYVRMTDIVLKAKEKATICRNSQ